MYGLLFLLLLHISPTSLLLSSVDIASIERLWIQEGGSISSAPTAAAIAEAESSGSPTKLGYDNSVGPETSYPTAYTTQTDEGLYQIANIHVNGYSGAQVAPTLLDPKTNTDYALTLSGNGKDFSSWSTYTNGAYQNTLQLARQTLQNMLSGTPTPSPTSSPGNSSSNNYCQGGLLLPGGICIGDFGVIKALQNNPVTGTLSNLLAGKLSTGTAAAFLLGGLVLVIIGIVLTSSAREQINVQLQEHAEKAAKTAALLSGE